MGENKQYPKVGVNIPELLKGVFHRLGVSYDALWLVLFEFIMLPDSDFEVSLNPSIYGNYKITEDKSQPEILPHDQELLQRLCMQCPFILRSINIKKLNPPVLRYNRLFIHKIIRLKLSGVEMEKKLWGIPYYRLFDGT